MTQRNFNQALRKGAVGERIMKGLIERNGWVTYQPTTQGKAHHFDMMATFQKERAIALDVKAKARLNKWEATGVNLRHFTEYKQFSERHNMDFWLIFVDEELGEVYGNSLAALERPFIASDGYTYPRNMSWRPPIRIWHLDQMIRGIHHLSDEEVLELRRLSQRNHEYEAAT